MGFDKEGISMRRPLLAIAFGLCRRHRCSKGKRCAAVMEVHMSIEETYIECCFLGLHFF